jgi:hypothetical protein
LAHETPGERGLAVCLPLSVPPWPKVRADGKRSCRSLVTAQFRSGMPRRSASRFFLVLRRSSRPAHAMTAARLLPLPGTPSVPGWSAANLSSPSRPPTSRAGSQRSGPPTAGLSRRSWQRGTAAAAAEAAAASRERPSTGLLRRPTPGGIVGGRFNRPCGPGAHSRAILETNVRLRRHLRDWLAALLQLPRALPAGVGPSAQALNHPGRVMPAHPTGA